MLNLARNRPSLQFIFSLLIGVVMLSCLAACSKKEQPAPTASVPSKRSPRRKPPAKR